MSAMTQFTSSNMRMALMQSEKNRQYAVVARQVEGLRMIARRMKSAQQTVLDRQTAEKLAKLR